MSIIKPGAVGPQMKVLGVMGLDLGAYYIGQALTGLLSSHDYSEPVDVEAICELARKIGLRQAQMITRIMEENVV